ncbi:glucuronate isomerase [Pontibacillus halophilus JSM 076056 = DSM 19796]|uniref:Uronate isomerase n=1 Tax=Pontibacillus halophilus JSM 076056 = DSM 19796 TaxID=1385510 RepID=A0A0A5GFS6_9BACI|nr:glucuronate isomerase [Pontibacillus halophilus JSM 076056 = DSM 19796]
MPDHFLLNNQYSKELYHSYAKQLPIVDFHNHLPPEQISADQQFDTITDVWLGGDHYKWRLMRANGIHEHYITGDATKKEKFMAWAETVPNTLGNPLFHWTHMELKHFFQIDEMLSPSNAEGVWVRANEQLRHESMSARNLLLNNKVEFVGTTDDPADDLAHHESLQKEGFLVKVSPSFRPDSALAIESDGFMDWVSRLEQSSGVSVSNYGAFLDALQGRIHYFDKRGCRASDHGLNVMVYEDATEEQVGVIFDKRRNGEALSVKEVAQFKTYTLQRLAEWYSEKGWVMQLHLGPLRNNNSRMYERLGKDSGFDSIGDRLVAEPLSRFMDCLEREGNLPKTILYCLNPRDYYILATMAGNFQDGSMPGKIQLGTAWWFNDHVDGMEKQMSILANTGLIKHFVGMLTDSRSFLSFSRHDYFRRILCNLLGSWVEKGSVPPDMNLLRQYVEDICYTNARTYFNL